ncbi:MAG: DNA mismatch repair protein MutT [Cytophagaceae bacterium]|nr:DNA mismatch repair protein MutT [Cytophagaceae bacterium]
MSFEGAKVMLFLGGDLLVIRRDQTEGIPWPGYLDFPGGGREGDERPEDCALRETREEVGLELSEELLEWGHQHGYAVFFAAHLPADRARDIRFGDEGYGWQLMPPEEYAARDDAIPHFRALLTAYLEGRN